MITIESLSQNGGIVSDELVQKTVKWKQDGGDMSGEVFVKRLCIGDVERAQTIRAAADDKQSYYAFILSTAIRLGDGSEQLTFEQAYKLSPQIAVAFHNAYVEVNEGDSKN